MGGSFHSYVNVYQSLTHVFVGVPPQKKTKKQYGGWMGKSEKNSMVGFSSAFCDDTGVS